MKTLTLRAKKWDMIYVENARYLADGETHSVKELRRRRYPEISVTVPGNALRALADAGVQPDPYYGRNSWEKDTDSLHLFYIATFTYDDCLQNPTLVFEGVDTLADVYLNGERIATTDNMFVAHEMEIIHALKVGLNELVVHIRPVSIAYKPRQATFHESAQKYNYGGLRIRKAAHSYGWDIFPRLLLGGIWREVYLKARKAERITQFYGYTVKANADDAELNFFFETELLSDGIARYELHIDGECGTSSFHREEKLWGDSGKIRFTVQNPRLWFPRNGGEPNLYAVRATLYKDGTPIDEYRTRMGIRTVELVRTSLTDEDGNGEFCFLVNGKKIFCMGTNWVPVDALHACDEERIEKILPMLNDLGCNMIRIWGGGVYENDRVYDFCDENGILIWQDFMMGCAIYPQDDEFAERIKAEATSIVKRLRQHPSIALWAGDNENDIAYLGWYDKRRNPNENRLTREVIPAVLRAHDFTRPYLPSSPYVDEEAYNAKYEYMTEDHLWGPRDYFKGEYYRNSLCHFVSETGYHGCPSPKALDAFIPKEYRFTATDNDGWTGIENNEAWLAHATSMEKDLAAPYSYRIRLMANQVTTLFGNSVPYSLEDFARASQISQAEAKKYFIERIRIAKWQKTGVLWWNLIDGWHQISDAVVSYDFTKKLAYHYIKRSQQPVCIIVGEPNGKGYADIYAVNDLPRDIPVAYTVTDTANGEIIAKGRRVLEADSAEKLFFLSPNDSGKRRFIKMEWSFEGETHTNHFVEDIKGVDYREYLAFLQEQGYDEFEGF